MIGNLLARLTSALTALADHVSVPVFTILGAFIEELIAPIPSPLVMTLAGSLAASEGRIFIYLFYLSALGSLAKTFGSWLLYLLIDKGEDFFTSKFGRLTGISHKEIESLGKYLGRGSKDYLLIFTLRAIPIVPTAPVSLVCGLVKINLRSYLAATFLGLVVRNLFYLYLGFTSVEALSTLNSNLESLESFGYILLFALLALLFLYLYRERRKQNFLQKLISRIKNKLRP